MAPLVFEQNVLKKKKKKEDFFVKKMSLSCLTLSLTKLVQDVSGLDSIFSTTPFGKSCYSSIQLLSIHLVHLVPFIFQAACPQSGVMEANH